MEFNRRVTLVALSTNPIVWVLGVIAVGLVLLAAALALVWAVYYVIWHCLVAETTTAGAKVKRAPSPTPSPGDTQVRALPPASVYQGLVAPQPLSKVVSTDPAPVLTNLEQVAAADPCGTCGNDPVRVVSTDTKAAPKRSPKTRKAKPKPVAVAASAPKPDGARKPRKTKKSRG